MLRSCLVSGFPSARLDSSILLTGWPACLTRISSRLNSVPVAISAIGILFLIFAGRLGGDPAYVRGTIVGREATGS